MMLQLHTVRTGIPDTPQTCLSASSFHEYHSDFPRNLWDIPQRPPRAQTYPGNSIYQQTTDANRHLQTRSYNLRSTGSMLRGTFVLRRHIWLVLTRAVDTMQANVVTTLSFDNHLRIWLNFAPSKHWIWQNPQMCPFRHCDLNVPLKSCFIWEETEQAEFSKESGLNKQIFVL